MHVCGFPFLQELERITEKKRAVEELRAQLDREKQTSQGLQILMNGITDRNTAKHCYSKGTLAAEVKWWQQISDSHNCIEIYILYTYQSNAT